MLLVVLGLAMASATPVARSPHHDAKRFFIQDVKDALQSAGDFLTQTYNSAKEQAKKLASGLDFQGAVDALVPDLTAGETVSSCVKTCDNAATSVLGQFSQSAHELCVPVCEGALAKVNELAHGSSTSAPATKRDVTKRFFLQDIKDALQSAGDFLTQTFNSAKEQALKLAAGLDFQGAVDKLIPDLTAGETVASCVTTCDNAATQVLGQFSQSAHELCVPVCEGALAQVNELAHGKSTSAPATKRDVSKRFFLDNIKDALQSATDFLTQTYNSAKEQALKLASGLDFQGAVDALVPDLTAGETVTSCVKTCDNAATSVLGQFSQSAHELCVPVCEGALAKVNELAHGSSTSTPATKRDVNKRFFLSTIKDAIDSATDFLTQTFNSAKDTALDLVSGFSSLDFTAAVDALIPDLTAGETVSSCVTTCDAAASSVLGEFSQSAHELCVPVCEGALAKVNEAVHHGSD